VLLNITPDHLDRYDSFDAYAASKARLFAMQRPTHVAVFGCATRRPVVAAASWRAPRARGLHARRRRRACTRRLALAAGPHNLQNAAAAAIAASSG
jgi:UDP-N-acetylmuramoylalanine--D-glutamate ligase